MAQHDYVIDNSTGANVRADINNVLLAISSNNSGSSAPSTTYALQFYADTTNNILKLRNAANDGFINLFTLAGGVDVDAASNFNEDVTFTGAAANIIFDKSDNALEFNDDAKATFGTGADCSINHSGADFAITNTTGNLNILNNSADAVQIRHGSENMIKAISDGAVELYFDNSKKAETLTTGFHVLGTFESDNFKVSNPGNNAVLIQNPANGIIGFGANNQTNQLVLNAGGNVGIPTDGAELRFGASDDLKLSHDGNHSNIINDTGEFKIRGNDIRLQVNAGNENYIKCSQNGEVEIYHDNTKQFETTSVGTQLTGQTRFATSGGTFCALTEVFRNTSHTAGASLSFQTVNGHGGGTVTVTLTVNGNAAVKTTKMFGMALRSTSNSGLTSEIFSINSGSGVSFSVSGSSQGVTVANNSSSACTCTVRFDMSGSL